MQIRPLTATDRPAFLALWQAAFGDGPDVYEAMEACFGDDLRSFVLVDGEVVAALTQFVMGDFTGPRSAAGARSSVTSGTALPVYVSYAINTRADARGRGYGSAITEFARDLAHSRGGASLLCPASPSLIDFYKPLGYAPWGYALQRPLFSSLSDPVDDHRAFAASDPSTSRAFGLPAAESSFRALTAEEYQALREQALADRTHVTLSDEALAFVEQTVSGLVELGLRIAEPGYPAVIQAVAAYTRSADDAFSAGDATIPTEPAGNTASLFIDELLVTDVEQAPDDFGTEAVADLAAAFLADHFADSRCAYRTPAPAETCANDPGLYVQAMISLPAAAAESSAAESATTSLPYFGFPFD